MLELEYNHAELTGEKWLCPVPCFCLVWEIPKPKGCILAPDGGVSAVSTRKPNEEFVCYKLVLSPPSEAVSLQTLEFLMPCVPHGCEHITFCYYKNITFGGSAKRVCSSAALNKYFVNASCSHLPCFSLYLGKAKELYWILSRLTKGGLGCLLWVLEFWPRIFKQRLLCGFLSAAHGICSLSY